MAGELPYQTWENKTGKSWSEARAGGYTSGSASDNLALQSKLNGGWNPYGGGGSSNGGGGGGSSDMPDWLKNDPFQGEFERAIAEQNKQRDDLLAKQKAEQEGLFGDYEKRLAGQEKLTDAYGRLKSEAGIPDIQKQVDIYKTEIYKVKDLLDSLDANINERTKGSFTNESQRNRQIAAEGDPLRTSLSKLGTAATPYMERLSSAMGEVGTMLGLTREQQATELKPLEMRISATTDRFAREMTGFNEGKTNELNGLLDKITRGRQLADQEWERIQTLAAEERAWAKTKEQMALQFEYDMKSAKASGTGSSNIGKAISDAFANMSGGATTSSNNSGKTSALDAITSGSSSSSQGSMFGDWYNKAKQFSNNWNPLKGKFGFGGSGGGSW